ncbi:MAG: aldose 1-epimerase [Alphaproteobacteria bacterium]|nr:aldose 1-epimerase [Alphaproteobacteria bacterium]
MNLITIENELFQCRIVPGIGGSIFSFDCKLGNGQAQPMLRRTAMENAKGVLDFSSWPLVPYSNRIKYGAFEFEGVKYKAATNYLGAPNGIHASHGQGWQFPWSIESANQNRCTLSFAFDPGREGMKGLWPFPYEARQRFELSESGLLYKISLTNTGKTNMPAGLGAHPYLPKTPGTTLQAKAPSIWEIDDEVIPVRLVPVPPEYDFSSPKALDDARLDSCFAGYGGIMQVVWPERPAALNLESSPNLGHFVVYTPQGENFFCAEPVSHKPDAVNDKDWKDNGLIVLTPGKMEAAWYKYEALRMPDAPQTLSRLRPWAPLHFGG